MSDAFTPLPCTFDACQRHGRDHSFTELLAQMLLNWLVLRVAWQMAPSVAICGIFWVATIAFMVVQIREEVLRPWSRRFAWVTVVGAVLNAVVTIANGGYMPVLGQDVSLSVWTTATDSHVLLFLADQYAGFSVGDFFIFAGILGRLGYWCARKATENRHRVLALRSAAPR